MISRKQTIKGEYYSIEKRDGKLKNYKQFIIDEPNKVIYSKLVLSSYRKDILGLAVKYDLEPNYLYRPRALSLELYGREDKDWLIMWLNNIKSVVDFNREEILVLPKSTIKKIDDIVRKHRERLVENGDMFKQRVT